MLVQVDDITPGGHQFVWLPHTTFDELLAVDVLAVPVLMYYARHTVRWDPTLTKLIATAGGAGKERLSRAYNTLISRGYLVRIEFGISIPTGEGGRVGQRFTTVCYSRVKITADKLDELVRQWTPGKFVIIPWGPLVPGQEREKRRVRVVSAEVYSERGAQKITAGPDGETLLAEHAGRRGARATAVLRTPPEWTPAAAARAAQTPVGEPVGPEVEEPTSGVTSANSDAVQVGPEVDQPEFGPPTSKEKEQPEEQPEDQQGTADVVGAPAALRLAGPETSTATPVGGPDPVDPLPGDQQTACAEFSVADAAAELHQHDGTGALATIGTASALLELSRRRAGGVVRWDRSRRLDPAKRAEVLAQLDDVKREQAADKDAKDAAAADGARSRIRAENVAPERNGDRRVAATGEQATGS